jgi:serine/threonine protein kinase
MEDLSGKTLFNKYHLRKKLPSGQIADVYFAWDNIRAADVAVKVLRRDYSNNQAFKEYFSTEATVMAELDHPNIVRLYDFCDDGQNMVIVMDWVNGANLKDLLSSHPEVINFHGIMKIFSSVCRGLNYAHLKNIIHCDIKPANIMIDSVERVLLTDFGISRYANQQNTGGTPPYMAPEQFSNGNLSPQTDVYALGVTLYELLSGGKVPFRGDTPQTKGTTLRDRIYWEVMHLPYPDVKQYNPKVPDAVDAVIKKAMNQNPSMRYSGAMDFSSSLEQAFGEKVPLTGKTICPDRHDIKVTTSNRPDQQPDNWNQVVDRNQSLICARLPARYRGPYLIGVSGQYRGYYVLIRKPEIFIGRASQNTISFSDLSISRKHAAIRVSKKGIFLSDENSKGGTYLNGRQITRMERLQIGDVIKIGITEKFEFRYR